MTESEQIKLEGLFNGLPMAFSLWFTDDDAYFQVSEYKQDYLNDAEPSMPPGRALKLTDGRWVKLAEHPLSAFKMAQFVELG